MGLWPHDHLREWAILAVNGPFLYQKNENGLHFCDLQFHYVEPWMMLNVQQPVMKEFFFPFLTHRRTSSHICSKATATLCTTSHGIFWFQFSIWFWVSASSTCTCALFKSVSFFSKHGKQCWLPRVWFSFLFWRHYTLNANACSL